MLRTGLLQIRVLGWDGQAGLCAEEADHLHNLPGLLADYSEEKLRYYWDVERPIYARRIPAARQGIWASHWDQLRPFVESLSSR
jgi:hypothetical protein